MRQIHRPHRLAAAGARGRGLPSRARQAAAAVLCLWLPLSGLALAQEVTPEALKGRMDQLVEQIKQYQSDGAWGRRPALLGQGWAVGNTALAVLALSSAGVPADDPALEKGLQYLLNASTNKVYELSLKAMALEMVDRRRYRDQIQAAADLLIRTQGDSGGWSYTGSERPDNSNSQFAVLGLRAAARSGIEIPDSVWKGAWGYFARGQNADGGWSYIGSKPSYGSMTVAGAASLYICSAWLHVSRGQCGDYIDDARIRSGLGWLADHFSVTRNPSHKSFKFYYLYSLERAGVIAARRYLGRHDWYLEGVAHLVKDPRALGGGRDDTMEPPLVRACFALLFLAKGNAPVLIHKAQWNGSWNPHRYDAKFLLDYLSDQFGRRLAWQIMPLDAPLDHMMAAPILYISGRGRIQWEESEIQRLKQYMQAGGFVFVEANEGDKEFDRSFRQVIREHCPDGDLTALPKDHPVYTCHFDLPADSRLHLEAIKGPCWMSLLYCPDGLSCPWDVAKYSHPNFKLGANVVAYVTGLEQLRGRLEAQTAAAPEPEKQAELRGAFVIGQLVHDGNWKPHKRVWRRILAKAHKEAGLSLFSAPVAVDPERESLFQVHVLNITGTKGFQLSQETVRKLRQYVERGGFIFAEAACGSREFDKSLRSLMKEVFPDHPLEEVPFGHPLFTLGRPLGEVLYSKTAREAQGARPPLLEQIEIDGRAVVIYTSYDLSSAISGHPPFGRPAVLEPSASQIVVKALLYALAS